MRGLAVLLLLALFGAGCAGHAATPSAGALSSTSTASATVSLAPAVQPAAPILDNATAQLRTNAAEVRIPAGHYALVRLVFDKEVWTHADASSGSAAIGMAFNTTGKGVLMDAFGFDESSFTHNSTIRPFIDFYPFQGSGWGGNLVSYSCSGCEGGPERDQAAYLVGGETNTTLRIGVFDPKGTFDPMTLWKRPALPILPDATTTDAFAGLAFRSVVLAQEFTDSLGAMKGTWSSDPLPGVGVQRTVAYDSQTTATQRGIFSTRFQASETVGIDQWGYSVNAPGLTAKWSGPWVYDPTGTTSYLQLTGLAYDPAILAQGNINPGPVAMKATRSYTAASDPSGLVSPSYDEALIGHAGVDLEALFGWDTTLPATPNSGSSLCTMLSPGIGLSHCLRS